MVEGEHNAFSMAYFFVHDALKCVKKNNNNTKEKSFIKKERKSDVECAFIIYWTLQSRCIAGGKVNIAKSRPLLDV